MNLRQVGVQGRGSGQWRCPARFDPPAGANRADEMLNCLDNKLKWFFFPCNLAASGWNNVMKCSKRASGTHDASFRTARLDVNLDNKNKRMRCLFIAGWKWHAVCNNGR
jgi:hypothetical protein